MGDKARVIILQNHGLLTAGSTVDEAAYLFTLMENTCKVQLLVEGAGLTKRYIGDQEAEFTARVNADPVRRRFD
jgi:ribulose-5-phosphate 4-epimerase/fuculose-1-phosphate aldolase